MCHDSQPTFQLSGEPFYPATRMGSCGVATHVPILKSDTPGHTPQNVSETYFPKLRAERSKDLLEEHLFHIEL
jgi:hypothetical protein